MVHKTSNGIENKDLNNDYYFRSNVIVTNTVSIVATDKTHKDENRAELIELRDYIFSENSNISKTTENDQQVRINTSKEDSFEDSINKEENKTTVKDIKKKFIVELSKRFAPARTNSKSPSRSIHVSLASKRAPLKANSDSKEKFNKIMPSLKQNKVLPKSMIRKQGTIFMDSYVFGINNLPIAKRNLEDPFQR